MNRDVLYKELHGRLSREMKFLPDKPEETVESTLRALWYCAAGQPRSAQLATNGTLPRLSSPQLQTLHELLTARIGGMPLAHITRRQHFMGMELLAGAQALVPRKETEILAGTAIAIARKVGGSTPHRSSVVLDVCTGSGNVALAIAYHVETARLYAADLSKEAVSLAKRNAERLALATRVVWKTGDLLSPFDSSEFHCSVDLLTCNPPYISTAKVMQLPAEIANHEPALAFDGGPFGVSVVMRLLREAPQFLRPGGWLAFEVGVGQGPGIVKRLEKDASFDRILTEADPHGSIRAICARRS